MYPLTDIYQGGPFYSMGFITARDERTVFSRQCQWVTVAGNRCENSTKQRCGERRPAICSSHFAAYEESLASGR